jgi:hypothetical protein
MSDPLSRLLGVELGTVPRLQPRALSRSAGGRGGADATPGIIEEHVEREWSNGAPTGVVQTRRMDGRTHQPIEGSRPLEPARVPSAAVAFNPSSALAPRGPLGTPSVLPPPNAPDAGAPSLRRDVLAGAGAPVERSTTQALQSKPFGAGSPSTSAPVGAIEPFADSRSAPAPGDALDEPAGEARSPRWVSTDVREAPSAEMPIWPGSTRPSPAQREHGEAATDLGHESLAPSAAGWASSVVVDGLPSGAAASFGGSHGAPTASALNATLLPSPESGRLVNASAPAGIVSASGTVAAPAGVSRITAGARSPAPSPAPFQLGAGGLAEAIHALAASAGAMAPANAAPASAARAATPVVRVRIGRIDIHAPIAPASSEPSAPRAEPARAGLSLDALLRLREES